MKKLLGVILVLSLILVSSGLAFSNQTSTPEDNSITVEMQSVALAVKQNPISIKDYSDAILDFLAEVAKKLAQDLRPALVLDSGKGEAALQVSILEEDSFNIVLGAITNGRGFLGVEFNHLPVPKTWQVYVEKIRPVIFLSGDKEFQNRKVGFGLSYELK